jgi:phosphopantothenoylcysteine decarboxylase/phosphopantothenate--cysteine ligase
MSELAADPTPLPPIPDESRIALGVSGAIAAYKSAYLTSQFIQQGATVRALMTEAATRFLGPLTLQSLTGRAVLTSVWESDDHPDSQHIGIARWCQVLVIAPASADLIARLAMGLTDSMPALVAAALPRSTPVVAAPSMNAEMWQNPVVQRNIATLRDELGYHLVGPEEGWQACRTTGIGRMSDPVDIYSAVAQAIGG